MGKEKLLQQIAAESKDRANISTVLQIRRIRAMLAEAGYLRPEEVAFERPQIEDETEEIF